MSVKADFILAISRTPLEQRELRDKQIVMQVAEGLCGADEVTQGFLCDECVERFKCKLAYWEYNLISHGSGFCLLEK